MRIVLLITLVEVLVLASLLLVQRFSRRWPAALTTAGLAPVVAPLLSVHWAQVNESVLEGQASDRPPVLNTLAAALGSPAAKRSSARRSHQLSFKKWSAERHD